MPEWMVIAAMLGFCVLCLAWISVNFYQKCPPNQAMIISGMLASEHGRQCRIVVGGGAVMLPMIQQRNLLSLEVQKAEVGLHSVYTKDHVPVSANATVQFKVNGTETDIMTAAEAMLGKTGQEVSEMVINVLDKPFMSIIEERNLNELCGGYVDLSEELMKRAQPDLAKLGMAIISISVKSIAAVYDVPARS